MYNTEDRIAKAVINGKDYELLMTVRAGIKLKNVLANFNNSHKNKNNQSIEKDFNTALMIFNVLHNEALRFRAYEEHKSYKPTIVEDFEFILDVKGMNSIKNAISSAISKSKIVDVPQSTEKN